MYLFNQKETYTIAELKQLTGVTDPALFKSCMLPLCNPKFKFLTYSGGNKANFNDNETIGANRSYNSKILRKTFKPAKTVVKKEVGLSKEEEQLNDALMKERNVKIQAKIVQIMKARKTMKYADLPMEVASQINHFKAQPR